MYIFLWSLFHFACSYLNIAISYSFSLRIGKSGSDFLAVQLELSADDAVSVVTSQANIYIPFAELVDIEKEIQRLKGEEKKLQGELARVNGMLNNEKFMSKAPEAKVAEERAKLEKYTAMMEQVQERLAQLEK